MTLTASLGHLEREQLIRRLFVEELEYAFKHALMQEAARSSLLNAQRRSLHRAVAQVFEAQPEFCQDEFAPVMAFHFAEAGDDANTLRYSILAGDGAAHKYASAEAIVHYDRALDAAAHTQATSEQLIHVFTKRGRAIELGGRYAEAWASYEQMQALAKQREDRALELAALLLRALLRAVPNPLMDVGQGKSLAEEALALAQASGDRAAEAKALWILQLVHRYIAQERSIEFGERSLAIARELNLREQIAYDTGDLCSAYWALGDADRAHQSNAEAVALWRELGNLPMLAAALGDSAALNNTGGDWDAALIALNEVMQIGEQCGNTWAIVGASLGGAFIALDRGDTRTALAAANAAIALSQGAGLALGALSTVAMLAHIFETMGNVAHALALLRPALSMKGDLPLPVAFVKSGYRVHAKFLEGDFTAADAMWQHVRPQFDRSNLYFSIEFWFDMWEFELAYALRDSARLIVQADDLLSPRWRGVMGGIAPSALFYRAKGLLLQGHTDDAYTALRESQTLAETMQSRQLLWKIYAQLSDIERQRGNSDEAAALRDKARETIDYIADHAPDDLRATFLAMPDVKIIFEA